MINSRGSSNPTLGQCQNPDAQRQVPHASQVMTWRRDMILPPFEQGVMIFDTPVEDLLKDKLEMMRTIELLNLNRASWITHSRLQLVMTTL